MKRRLMVLGGIGLGIAIILTLLSVILVLNRRTNGMEDEYASTGSVSIRRSTPVASATILVKGPLGMNVTPGPIIPPTPTTEIIPACTPTNKTETPSEGLKKARNALTSFFELISQHEYEHAASLYGGDYQDLRDSNPLLDPQDRAALLKNGCEMNGLQCLQVKRIADEKVVSPAEYHFTVEFKNKDGSLFVRGPCCGGNATDFPPESQFAHRVIRNCAGEFLVTELPVYVPQWKSTQQSMHWTRGIRRQKKGRKYLPTA